jgi:hypothetical protein
MLDKLLDFVKAIDLTKAEGDTIELTDEADRSIHQLLEVEKFIEEAKNNLKERYLEIAQKNPKLKSYEGNSVKVGYTMTRRKVITGTPDKKFYVVEKKPNTATIEAYREATGKLPEGVDEKTFEYIAFKLTGGGNDDTLQS